MSMFDLSLLDTVIATSAALVTMAIICCLCCVCIKISDMKLEHYIMKTSQQKGIPVDIEKHDLRDHLQQQSNAQDPCIIIAPNMGIMVAC